MLQLCHQFAVSCAVPCIKLSISGPHAAQLPMKLMSRTRRSRQREDTWPSRSPEHLKAPTTVFVCLSVPIWSSSVGSNGFYIDF